jgi:hypothetical protein
MKACGRQEPHFRFADVEKLTHKRVGDYRFFARGMHAECKRLRWSRSSVLAFGLHPAEAVGFLGRKNSQHDFLLRGSKAVGPMS